MDTENSDGLIKKKDFKYRESSGTKAHFTGIVPVYPPERWTDTGTDRRVGGKLTE